MHRYAPYYCEENVWWLAQEPGFESAEVVVITNRARTVVMHAQCATRSGDVRWDYHVVLASRGEISDFDCVLGMPLPASVWLDASFDRQAIEPPRFRLVPAARYVAGFASDRRHMRDANGDWLAPPPPWPIVGGGAHELDRWLDLDDTTLGSWCDLDALRAQLTSSAPSASRPR